jgi:hypothetical protein
MCTQRDKPIEREAASRSCDRGGLGGEEGDDGNGGGTREGVGAIYRAQKGAEQYSVAYS